MRVGFVCVEHAGRSQMAAAFATAELAERGLDDEIEVVSGGTEPAEEIHDRVREVMAEVGLELNGQQPSKLSAAGVADLDVVVTMGCSADGICPSPWDGEVREWGLADPADKDLAAVRSIRDEVANRVAELIDDIAIEAPGSRA